MKKIHPIIIGIACLLVVLESCAIREYQLRREVRRTLSGAGTFRSSHHGLLVVDPLEGREILNHNGDKFFTPASNTKLFTFYAAKRIMGDFIPTLAFCYSKDTLYFSGTGDPTFLHPDFPYQPAFDVLKESPDRLIYIPPSFASGRFGPGWSWDDFPYYYSAEKAPFPIYGNMIWVRKTATQDSIEVIPRIFRDQLFLEADTSLQPGNIRMEREEFMNRFFLRYKELPDSVEEVIPFNYSNELFTFLLEDTLKRPVRMQEADPPCDWQVMHGIPIDSLIRPFLLYSDNFFGEQLLLGASWVLNDTLDTKKAIGYAQSQLFKELAGGMYWVDGSGLSRYNQFTPRAMVGLLELIFEEYPEDYIRSILPAGGVSGTLRNRFRAPEPYIYAKTGSMSHVYNLSGYLLTASGRWFIFSFMNNNFQVPTSEIKDRMEEILLRIHLTY